MAERSWSCQVRRVRLGQWGLARKRNKILNRFLILNKMALWTLPNIYVIITMRYKCMYLCYTHQGFQSSGKGATIPSRAMNRRSFSLIGSIPMDCAYSNISAKKNSRMHNLWTLLREVLILYTLTYFSQVAYQDSTYLSDMNNVLAIWMWLNSIYM